MLPVHEWLLGLEPARARRYASMVLVSMTTSWLIFTFAALSIAVVYAVKAVVIVVVHIVTLIGELLVAVTAAITSGVTILLIVVVATGAASFSLPAKHVQSRVLLSACASALSVFSSMLALRCFSTVQLQVDMALTMLTAAAIGVAAASSWATAILSLVERETNNAGVQLSSVMDAVRNNRYMLLKVLLKFHFGIRQSELDNGLMQAVKAGHVESCDVLLQAGACANMRDSYENTPLMVACDLGMRPLVALLLRFGASAEVLNGAYSSPLHNCAKWGYSDCAQMLIDKGANVNQTDGMWRTPLMLAAKYANDPDDVMEILLRAGARVNQIGCEQRTVLHYAASRGAAIEMLLLVGANCSIWDAQGNIPLHYAALEGTFEALKQLLTADKRTCNFPNKSNQTPLHFAAINGNTHAIQYLLTHNADMRSADKHGKLAIWYASYHGRLDAVRAFIWNNCPFGNFEQSGTHVKNENPLRVAIERRHFEVVKILLLAGCDSAPVLQWLHDWSLESRDLYADHVAWLERHLFQPWNLAHVCRIVIRRTIQRKDDIDKLPIPSMLKNCIHMYDV